MVSILALGSAFLTFALADSLKGNGYLAVYICGIVLGNSTVPFHRGISRFMGGMSWLWQIVMFLMLGLLVMLVQRNGQHIIPNGTLHLKTGDALLIIKEEEAKV